MFCSVQEPLSPILANLQSNKRHKKKTLRFSHRFFAYMHLSKCEIFHSYEKSRKFFTFFSFLWSIILYEELKNVGSFGQVTSESQNCVTGVIERNLSQSQILKGIQEKNSVVPKYFFDGFKKWDDGL